MEEPEYRRTRLQWTWVGMSFLLYFFFYLLPILMVGGVLTGEVVGTYGGMFIGAWTFGGILILSAVAGFLSKGVTIWEPAIAGAALVVLFFASFTLFVPSSGLPMMPVVVSTVVTVLLVFSLSLVGAWWGEKLQKLLKKKPEGSEE